jgi:hypothetical protein
MAFSFPPNSPIEATEFFNDHPGKDDQIFALESNKPHPFISYTEDGRKLEDGILVVPPDAEILWKETIIRKLNDQILKATIEDDAKCQNK